MFDMDQFMADREASYRRRPLNEQERREYHSGDPDDEFDLTCRCDNGCMVECVCSCHDEREEEDEDPERDPPEA
jgi:hypothetical protein